MSLHRILHRAGCLSIRTQPTLPCRRPQALSVCTHHLRRMHATPTRRDRSFTNILADDNPPPVQVKSITNTGIQLLDGLVIPSACIFLQGKVFLWDVPSTLWAGWTKEHFEIFETIIPKPEILLLGTGKTIAQAPPSLRTYLNQLGIQVDVMDTRNACSTYNLLSEEGRRVAAALLPLSSQSWKKAETPER
ncbi:NADH dehydrogenase [ubiquinone] 1 alpha subcomplex assembly factor 3 [Hypsizygus marmoreus]|uniref:NADH dehydrogenase [ubiquinone] 1 alpha subcomplex assembly factor 3 n=1 Tax=Hypsizygus marmoreus TaxID=39966 RepID=A0A369JE47_HYPMA|nr:NADH dehydrogenase [ubiquinone] 1 alpha subcomplex assembly factor 3 [Hypsizygus marmoreus]